MTGYGSAAASSAVAGGRILIEITSVNRKTLDVHFSGPREWSGLGSKLAEWAKGRVERGRLQVQLKLESDEDSGGGLPWNEPAMEKALERLRAFAEKQGLRFEADGRLILELARSLKDEGGLPDQAAIETDIRKAFDAALADLNQMRETEGEALRRDLEARIGTLDQLGHSICEASAGAVPRYQSQLLERLREMNLELDPGDERVLKEVALFADRCDISEEITRLNSHLEQFGGLLVESGPVGRKLDFLCQEIHREFNTIGSKSSLIAVTRAVIEGKNELERIREQVQNVE